MPTQARSEFPPALIDPKLVTTDDQKNPKSWRDPQLSYILVSFFLNAVGLSLSHAAFPWAMLYLLDGDQPEAARVAGYLSAIFTACSLVVGPTWGCLSSRFGRKKVMLISLVSAIIDGGILMFRVPIILLIFVKLGCGATYSFITVSAAYVADVTPIKKRAFGYSLMWAAFSLAGIGFPILSGWLMTRNYPVLFQVAAAIHGLNFLFVLFVVPDVKPTAIGPFSWWEIVPFYPFRILVGKYFVISLCVLSFFISWAGTAFNILTLWAHYMWGWDAFTMGIVSTIIHVIALIQVPINRFVSPRIKESFLIPGAICFYIGAALTFVFMGTPYLMILAIVLDAIGDSAAPVLQGLASVQFSEQLQGDFTGVFICIRNMVWCVGPLMNGYLWSFYISPDRVKPFPAINFVISSGMFFACLVGSIVLFLVFRNWQRLYEEEPSVELNVTGPVEQEAQTEEEKPRSPMLRPPTPVLSTMSPATKKKRLATPVLTLEPLPEGF